MAYDRKDNSGALFRNDKGGNPNRPDYRGDALVNGELMEVAGWIKEGQKGKFMSLWFKAKDENPRKEQRQDADDSPPF